MTHPTQSEIEEAFERIWINSKAYPDGGKDWVIVKNALLSAEKMRVALEFYATGDYTIDRGGYWNNWTSPPTLEYPLLPKHIGDAIKDNGKKARDVLGELR